MSSSGKRIAAIPKTKTLTRKPAGYAGVESAIAGLLDAARHTAARSVNSLMTATFWEIGRRIVEFQQKGRERAAYGESLLEQLGADLSRRFGRGFGSRNLAQMRAFYLAWPSDKILQTVSAKSSNTVRTTMAVDLGQVMRAFPLSWSAYVRLLGVSDAEARSFYESEALRCGWSVRQLDRQIDTRFYERTRLSRRKSGLIARARSGTPEDILTPEQAIRDPFVLEFLDLKDEYSESDLENALIGQLADFLLELGDDFAFVGRQRRLRIDDTWFRVDLLFYHRRLKCLLVIDLKAGRFSYTDAGQMHLYLNYAREHWVKPGENPPIGLILCASKGTAEARYSLEGLPNKVLATEYKTVLPREKLLADKLVSSRRAFERRQITGPVSAPPPDAPPRARPRASAGAARPRPRGRRTS